MGRSGIQNPVSDCCNLQSAVCSLPVSAIYIHIPFCVRKCLYCDFTSYEGMEKLFEPYVEALKAEIRQSAARFPDARISTIYFGGGTPTVLPQEQLEGILAEIRQSFPVAEDAEITIESNPGVSVLTLHTPRSTLHNRLSLGIQSLHDNELRLLGRIHTTQDAVQAFRDAREAGFQNISLDLMYGIPAQTMQSWRETLKKALKLSPEHISLYSLTVEEGTSFHKMHQAGELTLPGNDIEADMYEEAIRVLTAAGFIHYEISNFAKPGYESRHNTTYWQNEPYFGFGAGATSYLEGIRAANTTDVKGYIRRIETGQEIKVSEEHLTGRASMGETMFLGLRMLRGVDMDAFARRHGRSLEEVFPAETAQLTKRGLIEKTDGFIRLTHTGLFLANEVFAEFV